MLTMPASSPPHIQAGFKREFVGSYLPLTLQKLEAVAAANNCPQGWIHGKKVCVCAYNACCMEKLH